MDNKNIIIPESILTDSNLKSFDVVVYGIISKKLNFQNADSITLDIPEFCKETLRSAASINRSIRRLIKANYLKITTNGKISLGGNER